MKQRPDQRRIASAVHRVVCESTGSDGYGQCLRYAVAGSTILTALTGRLWLPQVGTLKLWPDPDNDEGLEWNADLGGMEAGEFHAWIVGPLPERCRPGKSRVEGAIQLVDFAARHYRRMAEGTMLVHDVRCSPGGVILTLDHESVKPVWRRQEIEYLWVHQLPEWIVLRPKQRDTEDVLRRIAEFRDLVQKAKAAARRLR